MSWFPVALLYAYIGGLILNVMPCVLPVLTMKVFHLMERSEDGRLSNMLHGVAYGAGVLLMFLALGLALMALQATGELVGWGMQFSNPVFVATMVAVVFLFGLNALGVFELNVGMSTGGGAGGYLGSVLNGVVASIMSTPCSAPFLGGAAGFALGGAAPWQTVLIFLTIGVGLATPVIVFSFVPAAGRLLPRPGPWMESFRTLMGFTLMAAAAWLYAVLLRQTTPNSAGWFLAFLWVLALGAWLIGRYATVVHTSRQRILVRLAVVTVVIVAGLRFVEIEPPQRQVVAHVGLEAPLVVDDRINWRSFDPDLVLASLESGRPVFVDFTADWCVNCKTNERLFIETPRVRAALVESGVLPVQADLTVDDAEIRRWLEPFPVSGLPVYVIYYPDQTYDLLPQAITTELLVSRLRVAAERFPLPSS